MQYPTEVRVAIPNDAAEACGVMRSSIAGCFADHSNDAHLLGAWLRNKTPEFALACILAPEALSLMALLDKAVGFGQLLDGGELTLLYVAREAQYRGVGTAILRALERHALERGMTTLKLKSTRSGKAFYLRHGYEVDGAPTSVFGLESQPMRKAIDSRVRSSS